ncbi:hypothetical protein [Erwinia sp. E_sp_B01_9]|uniref:hypothetical protein n=1 Tax=Erwinia sp. E_sp_B01_9 TaxID=3039403 RepID=UPI003D9AF987
MVRQAIEELCQHADAVIVTCTTLGVVAWDASAVQQTRIADRCHAGKSGVTLSRLCSGAVHRAKYLESTTTSLRCLCHRRQAGRGANPRAWAYFNDGDIEAYHREIAHYVQQRPECALGCIVLAQASMAGQKNISTVRWPF